jgi:hypothetical protein
MTHIGLRLTLAYLALAAAVPGLLATISPAWSVAALLHGGYHALNLDGFGAADAIALIALLASVLALPALAIVLTRRERVPVAA